MSRWPALFATIVALLLLAGELVMDGSWCSRCADVPSQWCLDGHPLGRELPDAEDHGGGGGNFERSGEGEF